MTRLRLDWYAIRPLNGARADGFEELCAQLARAESPGGSHFERKGTPDAGVECYAVLSDGSEWGWQAKYFDGLGDSQWSQLDESVKTAIEKHPRLARYFICVPLDRPDARLDGRRSAKERWDEHVRKWVGWASARSMTVEFIYWGNHELLDRLSLPQNVGRVRFWFDIGGFDDAWFTARLDEALKTAGPRYTPELHVDLPIAAEFEAFGRTERFFNRIKAHARQLRKKFQTFEDSGSKYGDPTLDAPESTLSSQAQAALKELSILKAQPVGKLPFQQIVDHLASAETAVEELDRLLAEREREQENKPSATGANTPSAPHGHYPFRERRYHLRALSSEIYGMRKAIAHADDVAGRTLLLLRGAAGTGKTHLLCDIARHRVADGRPTVLLMGQRFVSADAPWTQALQQLDLPNISAEEFTGALEAAAQAANCRALVLVDAINEGAGRLIWPSHLAAFLAQLERSPWIAVVMSVRSAYEEFIVPESIRTRAVSLTHEGFAEHEYDATRTFFVHYSLELPSTPLLTPEFRNPLYLKTLCVGLRETGHRRLPRGFHGITATFNLFLDAVNKRLSDKLGFNPKAMLVRQALESFTKALVASGERWMPLDKARELVDALLPGRDFARSLYHGLVGEGILVENASWREEEREEVVFIGYERFADHLVADALLQKILGIRGATRNDGATSPSRLVLKLRLWLNRLLARNDQVRFLYDQNEYVAPGLLEALCVQIPERTGLELTDLYPATKERWDFGNAFRQSLIWRAPTAFSESTLDVLSKLLRSAHDWNDTLEVLLTVSTLPSHPLNATFLDQRLRRDAMPDRDSWWSTSLHSIWRTHGAIDRLVDWASSVTPSTSLDDEMVDLCATVLSWMLTTSNRFLRDRATKALVNLLTARLGAVVRLVEKFANIDDLYVAERIYAVAYGTVMRSHNPTEVGAVATCVYDRVFAGDGPPPHILLRDYARGVVERALHLGAKINVAAERIRPPYTSKWPNIPTEEDVKPLLPDWSQGSHDSHDTEWASNRIGSSVMVDDFARYVIGTNFSSTSSSWLALRLDEPTWEPPKRPADLQRILVTEFSDDERKAWEAFNAAKKEQEQASRALIANWIKEYEEDGADKGADNLFDIDSLILKLENAPPPKISAIEEKRETALAALNNVLTEEHARRLNEILEANQNYRETSPPRFDLSQFQRYILWRVFDLGWTTERFGRFDRIEIGHQGRDASKAERIGKKYQWIAYHEIMALVADHFQYRAQFREEDGNQAYDGPWQDSFRNIDPSCTLRASRGGSSWNGHPAAWWAPVQYDNWGDPGSPREWVMRCDDLPKAENFLSLAHPDENSRWLNVHGYFNWKQQPPADREATDVERRELWYICTGYLIRTQHANAFMEWAERVDFWGRWMPEPPEVYKMFLGEHGWSPASRHFQQRYFGDEGWTQPDHDCPAKVRTIAFQYLNEAGGFDCSVDTGYTLRLPASELVTGLGLRWTGSSADYRDSAGRLAAFDPTAHSEGPSALLMREDFLKEFLARERLAICWTILGEKRVLGDGITHTSTRHAELQISGAYMLSDKGTTGFLKCTLDDPSAVGTEKRLLSILRTKP